MQKHFFLVTNHSGDKRTFNFIQEKVIYKSPKWMLYFHLNLSVLRQKIFCMQSDSASIYFKKLCLEQFSNFFGLYHWTGSPVKILKGLWAINELLAHRARSFSEFACYNGFIDRKSRFFLENQNFLWNWTSYFTFFFTQTFQIDSKEYEKVEWIRLMPRVRFNP